MQVDDFDIGAKLRAYRRKKRLSITRLSEMSGIAASNLSLIELGKSSPTLGTLLKIATAYGAKVTAFLDEALYQSVVFCPPPGPADHENCSNSVSLTAGIPLREMEAKLIRLTRGEGASIEENRDCFVYCLDGTVEVRTEQNEFRLPSNYSVYIMPETRAVIENNGEAEASVLVIGHVK
jgi:XRE family transcriptional regulator, regulator of sulfur utilization